LYIYCLYISLTYTLTISTLSEMCDGKQMRGENPLEGPQS
jgi:hypothetical protein